MKRPELLDAGASRDDRRRKLAAVYLRVSSEEQREKETILTQRSELEPWIRERGYEVFDWYCDDGVSGDVPFDKRPEGKRLLEDAGARKFGVVVVYKINRLSRRAEDALSMVRHMYEDLDLVFRCSAQDFEVTGATGKLTLTMMAAIAEFDKEQILENTRGGHKRRAKSGKWPCGRPAYGYRIAGDQEKEAGRLVVHPDEGRVVQRIFRLYVEGMGMARIAALLSAEGVPSPKAGKHKREGQKSSYCWNASTVSFILRNRVYVGEGLFYRTKTVRREGAKVGLRELPEEDHVMIACPPLVTEDQFAAAQVQVARNSEFSARNSRRVYSLSGVLVCGGCGGRCVGYAKVSHKTPGLEWRYYVCGTGWRKARSLPCSARPVRAADVEPAIWAEVRDVLENPEAFLERVQRRYQESLPSVEEVPDLEVRLVALEEALSSKKEEDRRLATAYRKGLLGDSDEENELEFERQKAEVDGEAALLREEVVVLHGRLAADRDLGAVVVDLAAVLADLRSMLDDAETDEALRREIIRSVVGRVRVDEDALHVTFRPRPMGLPSADGAVSNRVQDMVRLWTLLEHTETLPLAA